MKIDRDCRPHAAAAHVVQKRRHARKHLGGCHLRNETQVTRILFGGETLPLGGGKTPLKPSGAQDDLQRRHAAHTLGRFALHGREFKAQFTSQRGPRQIVVAGRIDDNSVQIEYAAVYHFLNFGYQRYDFFAKKTRIRQRITYILVKYHLRKAAVFQN